MQSSVACANFFFSSRRRHTRYWRDWSSRRVLFRSMEWSLAGGRLADAADIAVAFAWYWVINGLADEGMRWLRVVATEMGTEMGPEMGTETGTETGGDDGRPVDVHREAAVLRSLGLMANPMGKVEQAAGYCSRSIALSRSVGDDVGTTAALLTLGIAQWAR